MSEKMPATAHIDPTSFPGPVCGFSVPKYGMNFDLQIDLDCFCAFDWLHTVLCDKNRGEVACAGLIHMLAMLNTCSLVRCGLFVMLTLRCAISAVLIEVPSHNSLPSQPPE